MVDGYFDFNPASPSSADLVSGWGYGFSDPLVMRARSRAQRQEKKQKQKKNRDEDRRKSCFSEKLGREIVEHVVVRDEGDEEHEKNMSLLDRVYYATTRTARRREGMMGGEKDDTMFTGEALDIITYGSVSASEVSLLPLLPSSSASSLSAKEKQKSKKKENQTTTSFSLSHINALSSIQHLFSQHSHITHATSLPLSDSSDTAARYKFFLTSDHSAAIYYTIQNSTAIMLGDPLCSPERFRSAVAEFLASGSKSKKRKGEGPRWKSVAFWGVSERFLAAIEIHEGSKYMSIAGARECVVDPVTNPVVLETKRKSIAKRCRALLDPARGDLRIGVYMPSQSPSRRIERELREVYSQWRDGDGFSFGAAGAKERDDEEKSRLFGSGSQADPFTLPHLTSYMYVFDTRSNSILAFAVLLPLGAKNGYHLSHPIIPPFASPKGLSDLLIYSTLSLLRTCNIRYLSLGYDVLPSLGTTNNMPSLLESLARRAAVASEMASGRDEGYRRYLEKFCPLEDQRAELFVCLPRGLRAVRDVLHFGGATLRGLLWKSMLGRRKTADEREREADEMEWGGCLVPVVSCGNAKERMALI